MSPEELQWTLNIIRERYEYLNLTPGQAKKVLEFETEKGQYSVKYLLSEWEEWDYEAIVFRKFLDPRQRVVHDKYLEERRAFLAQQIIDSDKNLETDLLYNQEILNYTINEFLPALKKEYFRFSEWKSMEKTKVTFLRQAYKDFLVDNTRKMLSQNFRFTRSFSPRQYDLSMIHNARQHLIPEFLTFRKEADAPTTAVIDYVAKRSELLQEDQIDYLTRHFQALGEFTSERNKFYYGKTEDMVNAFVFYLQPENEKEKRFMSVLLMDENHYGLDLSTL